MVQAMAQVPMAQIWASVVMGCSSGLSNDYLRLIFDCYCDSTPLITHYTIKTVKSRVKS
jgi:hypothetical protein